MSRGLYYEKLKEMVDSGRLSMFLIIAPPRTNSTLVEYVISNSPDIKHKCHEPFFGAGKQGYNPDQGYKQIYESMGGEIFDQSKETTSVAVKEIAHWIAINNEYKDLTELTSNPVLILIRNPLLSVESRIRKVLVSLEAGSNLDSMAQKDGYTDWQDLLKKKLYTEKDFSYFSEILRANSKSWSSEEYEFRELSEQARYLGSVGKPHYVLDTTDLRADPVRIVKELCAQMKISYSTEMVDWGAKQVDFHTVQKEDPVKGWYDTLRGSTKINPPTDIPPTLSSFPAFVQEYLTAHNLPVYAELSRKKMISKEARHDLNELAFDVQVSGDNADTLKRLGVIKNNAQEGQVPVKLKDIDPVYALTNEPRLFDGAEFRRSKVQYEDVMTLVSDCMNEATKEPHKETSENRFR